MAVGAGDALGGGDAEGDPVGLMLGLLLAPLDGEVLAGILRSRPPARGDASRESN